MNWAEVLAAFNFVAWLLPLCIKFYVEFKTKKIAEEILEAERKQFSEEMKGKIKFKKGGLRD